MTALETVRSRAEALITEHLGAGSWAFGFDHAKTRAGQCDFARKRITVSRHLAARFSDDDVEQVLLHEVAHALAGARAGHGPKWKRTAAAIGYTGSRLHDGPIASELAPWIGTCPAGHEHFRYRTPTRPLACARCSRRFDARNAIVWRRRSAADDPSTVASTTA
ncbi:MULTISPECIES: SprT-like domain-containing protein [Curtobacterium]|uniref:SprT-like domain-containing protein n=1 Tax=Curtobacterium citreum TaxID=2036 RepID=A0ABU8YET3_9MICO|nr:SprT-like domain-containing protein [Curtobacterium sp. JUb34]PZO59179.1 MAG: sprT domain-containing protein [Leifsonia xyli]ROR36862.1 SprT-like family protein [Curtobacterium sp. JUb34]